MRQVSINPVAELELVSGSSLAAVAMAEESTLDLVSGVSSGTVDKVAASEIELLTGPQADGFLSPSMVSWLLLAQNTGLTSARVVVQPGTETSGAIAQVSFRISLGLAAVFMPFSTPEQNSPHYATLDFVNGALVGQFCDLHYRWTSGAHQSDGYILLSDGGFYVPGFGEIDHENGG